MPLMKKDGRKARKLQREKVERLVRNSAQENVPPDSKRGRRIHTCRHYTLTVEGGIPNIFVETPIATGFMSTKHRVVMNNYIHQISDTECQCCKCHKIFSIDVMNTLEEIEKLQEQRNKFKDLHQGLFIPQEDEEIRVKIEELEKEIPTVRYRRLSPTDFVYVDEE